MIAIAAHDPPNGTATRRPRPAPPAAPMSSMIASSPRCTEGLLKCSRSCAGVSAGASTSEPRCRRRRRDASARARSLSCRDVSADALSIASIERSSSPRPAEASVFFASAASSRNCRDTSACSPIRAPWDCCRSTAERAVTDSVLARCSQSSVACASRACRAPSCGAGKPPCMTPGVPRPPRRARSRAARSSASAPSGASSPAAVAQACESRRRAQSSGSATSCSRS